MEFNVEEYFLDQNNQTTLKFKSVSQLPDVTAQSAEVELVWTPESNLGQFLAGYCPRYEVKVLREVTITRESAPHFWDFCTPDGAAERPAEEQDVWKLAVVEMALHNAPFDLGNYRLGVFAFPSGKPSESRYLWFVPDIVSIMIFEGFVFLNYSINISEIHLCEKKENIHICNVMMHGCGFVDSTVYPQSLIVLSRDRGMIYRYINFRRKPTRLPYYRGACSEQSFTWEFLFEHPIPLDVNLFSYRELLCIVDARGFVWLTWRFAQRGIANIVVLAPDFRKVCEFSPPVSVEFVECCPEGAILRKGEQHVLVSLAADEAPLDAPAG